jgi:hypothetical protein
VIFETDRFRVHTTAKSVWVETRESSGWVLREQRAIPIPKNWLTDSSEVSALKDAFADFERIHPGDTSMLAALTGIPQSKPPQVKPREQPRPVAPKKQPTAWRQPLRPPLRPILPASE